MDSDGVSRRDRATIGEVDFLTKKEKQKVKFKFNSKFHMIEFDTITVFEICHLCVCVVDDDDDN